MAIQWTEELAIGVEVIDNQHREIFREVNNLLSAMMQGKGKDIIGKVLAFLTDYVVVHFRAEEELMTRHDYIVGYTKHKAEHMQFIRGLSGLKKEFELKGVTQHLVIQIPQWLRNWLTNHIGKEDKKLGAFLKTKG